MKIPEINIVGNIDNTGKLKVYKRELNEFAKKNKNSKIVLSVCVYNCDVSSGQRGYYFGYVCKQFQQGLFNKGYRLNIKEVDEYIRKLSPIMYDYKYNAETDKLESYLISITELNKSEFEEYLEHAKQLAAEELHIFIDDPKLDY